MAGDGDGGNGKHTLPIADIVNIGDLFATNCVLENHAEYFRLIFSTQAIVPGTGSVEELVPSARIVMPPSGLMALAETVLAHYVRKP